jgi:5-methyltetrahydropteroyltriglutamate--homocysteine methyltransferase
MEAISQFERGIIDQSQLDAAMDDSVRLAVREQEDAGIDIISDGEQRRISFLAMIGERVEGFRLLTMPELAAGRPAGAQATITKLMLPSRVPQPVAVEKIRRTQPIAVHEFEFTRKFTGRHVKVPLPSPYMLAWQAWDDRYSRAAYPTPEDLAKDLAAILREEILALRDAGCSFVQLDDPTILNPLTPDRYMRVLELLLGHKARSPQDEFEWAVELINRTTQGIDGIRIGYHVCRGNWPAPEERLLAHDYREILPTLVRLKVDQLVLEFATPRAGSVDVFRDYPTRMELGLGVVDVKNKIVEDPRVIVDRAKSALRYFDATKLFLNPDCGFASGRDWPVLSSEIAVRKLRAMSQAAETVRSEFS